MKEQILNTFAAMGFQLEEMEGFGYGFRYEGINYLYMPNDDDEDFLNIAVPAIVEINDENVHAAHMLMDKLNSTLKYVKANKLGDSMWLFYERELYGGEDFEKLLSRMILHLEAALNFYRNAMANIKEELDSSDDDKPSGDNEEAA
jgi:hypothetical protein